jgi:hypothetical protein
MPSPPPAVPALPVAVAAGVLLCLLVISTPHDQPVEVLPHASNLAHSRPMDHRICESNLIQVKNFAEIFKVQSIHLL